MDQHNDTYPWTWEPVAAAIFALAITPIWVIQLGRAIAMFITGYGWQWPSSNELVTTLPDIITGNLHAGLNTQGPTSAALLWSSVTVLTVLLLTLTIWVVIRIRTATRSKGMATSSQAQQLLGVSRLRRNRKIIRPDLYRKA